MQHPIKRGIYLWQACRQASMVEEDLVRLKVGSMKREAAHHGDPAWYQMCIFHMTALQIMA